MVVLFFSYCFGLVILVNFIVVVDVVVDVIIVVVLIVAYRLPLTALLSLFSFFMFDMIRNCSCC